MTERFIHPAMPADTDVLIWNGIVFYTTNSGEWFVNCMPVDNPHQDTLAA